ncbi:MAG TPA: amino acid adenylation domain-containing protein [Longimicrobium sp.]|nr:amino acid adenylation domain-containing protein [Longimicrobium sp.]
MPSASRVLHGTVEHAARARPGDPAVVAGGAAVSYVALNERANRLARHLRAMGVRTEDRVALCVERSPDAIVAVLAVLKAGAAYVPIDPAYPAARVAALLEDARPALLVTQRRLLARLPVPAVPLVCLDADAARVARHSGADLELPLHPENAAYVIYTSGSTGRPKGVVVPHGAAVDYVRGINGELGVGPGDRVLQFSSLAFDVSVEEVFLALAHGAALVLRPDGLLDPALLMAACAGWGITVLDLPTAFWAQLAAHLEGAGASLPPSVRLVLVGGERATRAALARWRARVGPPVRTFNLYGPTEAVVTSTWCELAPGAGEDGEVPIGRATPDALAYLLDAGLAPTPEGAAGEIVLGGGLARGYLHHPGRTAERFVPDPRASVPGARMYRTGDLARRRPSGELEFVGRMDDQVKVRGFRIELGEVEAALAALPGVAEAVAAVREDSPGDARLHGYLVPRPGASVDPAVARALLRERLPAHMIPSTLVVAGGLPRTVSGKVDRRALAAGAPLPPPAAEPAPAVPAPPVPVPAIRRVAREAAR